MIIYDVVAPENEQYRGRQVGEIADGAGPRAPWDVLTEIALADELNTSFGTVPRVETDDDWKARVAGLARRPRGDRRVRRRRAPRPARVVQLRHRACSTRPSASAGCSPLEEAVHLITDVPAQLYGLRGRGRIDEGANADVVVLDPDTVGERRRSACRWTSPAAPAGCTPAPQGIEHVLVNGRAIVRDDELTDERSGTLLRSGRDTRTAPLA